MHILLVAATTLELEYIYEGLKRSKDKGYYLIDGCPGLTIEVLITGVGIHPTTYRLTKRVLSSLPKPDWVLNVGIAGSFNDDIKLGDGVIVNTQTFVDWGVADPHGFLSVFELKFEDKDQFPFTDGQLQNPNTSPTLPLREVSSITSNSSHGTTASIRNVMAQQEADIESMEGAAVSYVCIQEGVPYIELRTISNRVEKRDFTKWDIPLAKRNLATHFLSLVKQLKSQR
ncbi:futalosine hydrolase [Halosquirtibacter xylanolyticus]|uniref:futalosine hydrolase n=1 Tax=Halosquirtibacter xylanolyticus TaxID=3374599 RepID=UPI00374A06AB|nr:futalosine hydrolase [Prolixibacteraceae bacterium]